MNWISKKVVGFRYLVIGILCFPFFFTACGKEDYMEKDAPITTELVTAVETGEEKTITETIVDVTTETVTETVTEEFNPRCDILIAIDPGHQAPSVDMSATEPNAPGSSVMKRKATSGTVGKYTGKGEYELNLDISHKLKDALEAKGYQVIMTRENNETAISNAERAQLANDAGANISIRIHANGSDDAGTNGALVLVGSKDNPYVGWLHDDSCRLGENVLNAYCDATGMKNLGIQDNDTMTGINWSRIPVIILEMGFMSNRNDDTNMQDTAYQAKMVEGIVTGIEKYYSYYEQSENPDMPGADNATLDDLQDKLSDMAASLTSKGASASVYVEKLSTGEKAEYGNASLRAASLIKLYIAGCIYEEQEKTADAGLSDVDGLVKKMITVSDNDAANTLVNMLGGGDSAAGMAKVNGFCLAHGLTDTHMGRLLLASSENGENYTSVRDSAAFMRSIYNGRLAGSDKMLDYLKQQERTGKIPAGVPAGIVTANKTGELDHTENDVAIVYADGNAYVISVMTDNVQDAAAARSWIVDLSKMVYQYFGKL